MNNSSKKRFFLSLSLSLGLNLALVLTMSAWVYKKGGVQYLGEQTGLIRTTHQHQPWQRNWIERNNKLPNTRDEIVFLGDSITAAAPWAEYFSIIRNRGIGGDTTDGVLQRLEEVTESRPRAVFVQLGTNDLSKEISVSEIATNMEAIIEQIMAESPDTRVFIAGVMPLNLDMRDSVLHERKQDQIPKLNEAYRAIADAHERVVYIDLYGHVVDRDGQFKQSYTHDGLHPNDKGYAAMIKAYEPFVLDVLPDAPKLIEPNK